MQESEGFFNYSEIPDINVIAKDLIKDLGFFVITRRCVMDRYEKVAVDIISITK